jgi:acetoin utilization protein AcuC
MAVFQQPARGVVVPASRTALIYSPLFGDFSYGDDHPFKLQRYRLVRDLMEAYGLLKLPGMEIRDCRPIDDELVLTFHAPEYVARLKEFSTSDEPRADFRFGLGDADCPVFKGLYDCAALGAGATFEAARLVEEEGFDVAFNLAGGWHHAHRARASGFSYVNDAVLAINWLVARGRRVVYLDIDAHHGDGVQEGFYDSNRVLTISLHESGIYFFPGTGFENEIGQGGGRGYSVNVPLIAHTDDALYMKAFDEVAYPLIAAYDPDVIVTQIGADAFRTDPLTRLEITTHSYGYIMRKLKALKIPWVALGGGGYDLMNTSRAWTIAWAIMNGVELNPRLPAAFVKKIEQLGYPNRALLDAMHWSEEDERNLALDAVEKSIARIRAAIFPGIVGTYGKTSGK